MDYKPDYKYIPPANIHWLTRIYDTLCSLLGLGKNFQKKILEKIEIKAGDAVLDVGCGTGVFLEMAVKNFPESKFIGIDPDEASLAIAHKRIARYLNATLIKAFAESLPLSNESIDICFSTLAFHHMPDEIKKKAVAEIHRVLKERGKVLIADFGKVENKIIKGIVKTSLSWEKYIEENLDGKIFEYLAETGFKNIKVAGKKFPVIQLILAEK